MIDITQRQHSPNILNVAYIFTNLDYLVADKYGNFYNLEHCLHKRTQEFKLLKKSKYIFLYIMLRNMLHNKKESKEIFPTLFKIS